MSEVHVIFSGRYGLANRIRSMAGHYALSSLKGMQFSYEWVVDPSCPGLFSDVFISDLVSEEENKSILGKKDGYLITYKSQPTHCGSDPSVIAEAFGLVGDDLEIFEKKVNEFYKNLRPSKKVQEIIDGYLWRMNGYKLGIHLRRTDLIDHCLKKGLSLPSDTELYEHIDRSLLEIPSTTIFLSADNPESEKFFIERYKGKVLSVRKNWDFSKVDQAKMSSVQERLSSLDEAVIDLYILSKCDFIIGTKHSSFSSFAAKWGSVDYIRV